MGVAGLFRHRTSSIKYRQGGTLSMPDMVIFATVDVNECFPIFFCAIYTFIVYLLPPWLAFINSVQALSNPLFTSL
jgi:hypothetical protein